VNRRGFLQCAQAHDPVTGKRGEVHSNWYAGNAFASAVLYELDGYIKFN
jgi:hypothetical protein